MGLLNKIFGREKSEDELVKERAEVRETTLKYQMMASECIRHDNDNSLSELLCSVEILSEDAKGRNGLVASIYSDLITHLRNECISQGIQNKEILEILRFRDRTEIFSSNGPNPLISVDQINLVARFANAGNNQAAFYLSTKFIDEVAWEKRRSDCRGEVARGEKYLGVIANILYLNRNEGKLSDMTLGRFADHARRNGVDFMKSLEAMPSSEKPEGGEISTSFKNDMLRFYNRELNYKGIAAPTGGNVQTKAQGKGHSQ